MLRYICFILVSFLVLCQITTQSTESNLNHNIRWQNGVKVIKIDSLNLVTPAVQNQAKTAILKNNDQNNLQQITIQSEIKPLQLLDITSFNQNNSLRLFEVKDSIQNKNNQISKVALECKTVYLPDLDACIPFQCPQKYEWNQQLRQCRLLTPQCKRNYSWNGAVCLPSAILSLIQIQKQSQQFQKNRYVCPNGQSKCQKKVCPQGFTWIESSCVPKNNQQKCPISNLINGICQPSYSVQITIRPTCIAGIQNWNGTACVPISIKPLTTSIKQKPINLTTNKPKVQQQKQLLPKPTYFTYSSNQQPNKILNPSPSLINRQLPTQFFATSDYLNQYFTRSHNLFTPQIQNKIPNTNSQLFSTNKIQQIDLRVPGVITPKIITPPAPSFVPQAQPRYII